MGLADYWKSGAFEEEETGAIPEPAAPVQNSGLGDYWKGLSNQPAAPESPPAQQTGIEMPSPLVSKPTGIVPPSLTASQPGGPGSATKKIRTPIEEKRFRKFSELRNGGVSAINAKQAVAELEASGQL